MAQDGLVDVSYRIERDILALADAKSPDAAARFCAAFGVLVQFSPYSLNSENPFHAQLVGVIQQHRALLEHVAGETLAFLDAVVEGLAPNYRSASFHPDLEHALHGEPATTFAMQKSWSRAPAGCLDSEAARTYLQALADDLVQTIDADFSTAYALADPTREAATMGCFVLLLVLDHIHVDPAIFRAWRSRWHSIREPAEGSGEAAFVNKYNACLEKAFAYADQRFSKTSDA